MGHFRLPLTLEALREDRPLSEIAGRHKIHPNQVGSWKRQAIEGMTETFTGKSDGRPRAHEEERNRVFGTFTRRSGS